MSRERGQALVETVALVPLSIACAVVLVDCGRIVRDRIAVSQAAAAAIHERGDLAAAERAARAALPKDIRATRRIEVDEEQVLVSARSGGLLANLAGGVVHESRVTKEVPR